MDKNPDVLADGPGHLYREREQVSTVLERRVVGDAQWGTMAIVAQPVWEVEQCLQTLCAVV